MLTAREAALKAVSAFRKSGAWSDIFLDKLIRENGLEPREAALASAITAGTIKNLYFLDHCIGLFSSVPVKKLHPIVCDILRISAFQIMFMDRIPHSAAVNEAVLLTKKQKFQKASGLVNAVLRRISENRDSIKEPKAKTTAERLSIKYSHPVWLSEHLINEIGAENTEQFFAVNNEPAPITVHANTLKCDEATLHKIFSAEDIECIKREDVSNCYDILKSGDLTNIEAFKDGMFYVQDTAAYIASLAAEAAPGSKVLDTCAAPGGKSITAAMLMKNSGEIISCDIHEKKLRLISANALRLGINIIKTRHADALKRCDEFVNAFDTVIADVPCSGLGVIRKKPDIKYKTNDEILPLCDIQRKIINNVCSYVRPGGILIYSTCTILRRENEDVVNEFLASNNEFELVPFAINSIKADSGMLTMWPHINGTDGFFIAKLRRKV